MIEAQGVALGATSHAADDRGAGDLVWPFDHCLPTPFTYYVVSPHETAQEPAIAAFRDWLIAEAERPAAGR